MENITKFSITVDRRQEYKGEDTIFSDLRVWLRLQLDEDQPGERSISFLLIGDEAANLFGGKLGALADGYHQLIAHGELWVFYDIDTLYHGESSGTAPVKYNRVTVPGPVQLLILAEIEAATLRYDSQGDKREEVILNFVERLAHWSEHYGQGKGRIEIRSHQSGIEAKLDAHRGEESFDQSWESIKRLALNTTHCADDIGEISIMEESERSFLWTAGRMTGGLINHARGDESPSWSVHT
jgi:hypothetical protein